MRGDVLGRGHKQPRTGKNIGTEYVPPCPCPCPWDVVAFNSRPYSTTSPSRPSRCCAPLTAPRRYSRLAPGFASTVGTRLNLSSRFPSWVRLSSPVATALNRGRSDKRSLSHVRVDCQPVFGYSCIKGRHRRLRPKRPSPASRFFQTLFLLAPAMLTLARSSALRNSFRHLTSARAVSWLSHCHAAYTNLLLLLMEDFHMPRIPPRTLNRMNVVLSSSYSLFRWMPSHGRAAGTTSSRRCL